jgi:2-(1,2-epoxy-1,2-dihydrophenyl)acetyl-CoA isomerase
MRQGKFTGFERSAHDPGIALIQFNEPARLNGMTQAMKRDLVETLLQAQMDDSVRVVVFQLGPRVLRGRRHSATRGRARRALDRFDRAGPHTPIGTYEGLRGLSQPLNLAVRSLDKLCIAALNGVAIQTGFSLALACDFRLAAESARMGNATLRFGLLPDEGGQYLLVQHLGVARAFDFLMRKRIVSAAEALELGLVHEVVPDAELLARALELAREFAEGPQVAMRLLKRSLYNAAQLTFELSCDEIAAKTALSDHHPDAREGVRAFQEKRPPRFNRWLEK